jgi:uncharacterized coiled-coil protein SlyX
MTKFSDETLHLFDPILKGLEKKLARQEKAVATTKQQIAVIKKEMSK